MNKTVTPGTKIGSCTLCTPKAGHRQGDPDKGHAGSAATTGKGKALHQGCKGREVQPSPTATETELPTCAAGEGGAGNLRPREASLLLCFLIRYKR